MSSPFEKRFAVHTCLGSHHSIPSIPHTLTHTQDYSCCIKNPPPDLRDIDKYHQRFRQYGDIVTITLALDNGHLLDCIARKKEVEKKLAESLEGTRLLEAERVDYDVHVEQSRLWKKAAFALGLYEDTSLLWKQRQHLKAAVSIKIVAVRRLLS